MSEEKRMNSLLRLMVACMSAVVIVGCAETKKQTQIIAPPPSELPLASLKSVETPAIPTPPPIVSAKHATLTNLSLDSQGNQITTKPGQSIQATLNYVYNCPSCNQHSNSQIIVGLANRSAQACIYDGTIQGQGLAAFELKVPAKPGKYDVRFRVLQAADCEEALKAGWGADNSPSAETTIGKVIASKKAESENPYLYSKYFSSSTYSY